jgi:hypothetical protein
MSVTIDAEFHATGKGASPTHDTPNLALALRQIADDLAALNTRQKAQQAKLDSFIGNYNSHRGAAGVHVDADVDNTITSTAATDPTADILALLNDEVTQYEAHRILTAGGVHGAADTTNVITATHPAATEAEAVALGADLYTQYEAHRVLTAGGVHGAADNTNTIASASPTDWDSLVTFCNEFKNTTAYEQHRILTGGGEHGAQDTTNVVTAADSGAQITALQTEVNEIKADYNLHAANLGVHSLAGTAEGTANASDEATAVALVNALKATLNTHFANTGAHLNADASSSVTASDCTEYEDILVTVADVRDQYEAHRVLSAVHAKADAGNAETVLGTGAEVTIGLLKG